MSDEQFLTSDGAEELRQELDELINVKRPQLANQLREAISQGDLSENADYVDAKEQQSFLEGRIQYLENLLRSATIISETADDVRGAPNTAQMGCAVTITTDGEPPITYRLVGAAEADPRNGKISNESPLGAALLGSRINENVSVQTPDGEWVVSIVDITW